MKKLIWKEFRENLKWAAGALLFFSGAPLFTLNSYWQREPIHVFQTDYVGLLSVGIPMFGILLGFLQIFAERSRDLRSFLIHRPVSPSQIFSAKIIIGFFFIIGSAAIPTLVVHCIFAGSTTLGTLHTWWMVLPLISDIGNALICYLAALLTTQRNAKWFLSRTLPLITTCCAAAMITEVAPEFWHASVAQLLIGGTLFLAARGSFLANGEDNETPAWGFWTSFASHFAGIAIVTGLTAVVIASTLIQIDYRLDRTQYDVTSEGRIVQLKHDPNLPSPVWTYRDDPSESFELSNASRNLSKHGRQRFPRNIEEATARTTYRTYLRYFLGMGANEGRSFVFDNQKRIIRLFETATGAPIGVIDLTGFHTTEPVSLNPFPQRIDVMRLAIFVSPNFAWRLDLKDLSPKELIRSTPEEVWSPRSWSHRLGHGQYISHTHLISTNRYIVLDETGEQLIEMKYTEDLNRYSGANAGWIPATQQFYLQYHPNTDLSPEESPAETIIAWYSKEGALVKTQTLPLELNPTTHTSEWSIVVYAMPPGFLYLMSFLTSEPSPFEAVLIFLVGVVSGVAGLIISRRIDPRWQATLKWSIVGGLGGLPGLLTLMAFEDGLLVARCAQCRMPNGHGKSQCQCSNEEQNTPAPDGTEVFEDLVYRSPEQLGQNA